MEIVGNECLRCCVHIHNTYTLWSYLFIYLQYQQKPSNIRAKIIVWCDKIEYSVSCCCCCCYYRCNRNNTVIVNAYISVQCKSEKDTKIVLCGYWISSYTLPLYQYLWLQPYDNVHLVIRGFSVHKTKLVCSFWVNNEMQWKRHWSSGLLTLILWLCHDIVTHNGIQDIVSSIPVSIRPQISKSNVHNFVFYNIVMCVV